jgi:hypothetical protein
MGYFAPQNEIEELYMGRADYGGRRSPLSQTSTSPREKANIHHGGTETRRSEEEKEFLMPAACPPNLYNDLRQCGVSLGLAQDDGDKHLPEYKFPVREAISVIPPVARGTLNV